MYNAHADVTALISPSGEVKGTYEYDAFGNIINQTGEVNNSITYAGYQYDEETDLYYLNARYYDSKIARFITEDTYRGNPTDPLSLNLYTYCHNEPIMYFDPTGHWEEGDSERDTEIQAIILEATREYIEAQKRGDAKGMEEAHQKAEEARNTEKKKVHKSQIDENRMLELVYVLDSNLVSEKAKKDLKSSIVTVEIKFAFAKKATNSMIVVNDKNTTTNYLKSSGKQILLGNFTEDVTILGTGGQILLSLLGIDLLADIRDVYADISNWEWTWEHTGQTLIDGVGLISIIGAIKYTDEAEAVSKSIIKALSNADEVASIVKIGEKILTSYDEVAKYISKNGTLPKNFITKNEAKALGWNPKAGNLAEVAPGKSIGGDIFRNKGTPLPIAEGRIWYEADINYKDGFRGKERILYSNDGLIYKTDDHYTTFVKIK